MTQAWSIYVELGHRDAPDDLFDDLQNHARLADASPAIGDAPNGNLSVSLLLDAPTARIAVDQAMKTVTAALRDLGVNAPIVGVEAVTEAELERRNAELVIPDLVGIAEIADMLGVSRARAKQLTDRDGFPPAVARLKAGPVYVREQVEAFERRWDRRGGRPPKPVDLTSAERDLLAALYIARNAIVHGERNAESLLELLHATLVDPRHEFMRLEPLPTQRPMRLYLAAEGGKSAAWTAVVHQLLDKRLITVSEAEEPVQTAEAAEVIDLDLTAKGERLASV